MLALTEQNTVSRKKTTTDEHAKKKHIKCVISATVAAPYK